VRRWSWQRSAQTTRAKPGAAPLQNRPRLPSVGFLGSTWGTERSVAVSAVPITVRSVQRAVSAVGGFYGYDEVTVMAEVSGVVAKVITTSATSFGRAISCWNLTHGLPTGRGRNPAGPGTRGDPDRRER